LLLKGNLATLEQTTAQTVSSSIVSLTIIINHHHHHQGTQISAAKFDKFRGKFGKFSGSPWQHR